MVKPHLIAFRHFGRRSQQILAAITTENKDSRPETYKTAARKRKNLQPYAKKLQCKMDWRIVLALKLTIICKKLKFNCTNFLLYMYQSSEHPMPNKTFNLQYSNL